MPSFSLDHISYPPLSAWLQSMKCFQTSVSSFVSDIVGKDLVHRYVHGHDNKNK